ncbi:hypothetical protein P8452_13773 [Trifolium repens]|nr:hypothetical protein P8452_13773 [Trifolium repens]
MDVIQLKPIKFRADAEEIKQITQWRGFYMKNRSRVDFKIKHFTIGGKRLKLTIWDTGRCFPSYSLSHFHLSLWALGCTRRKALDTFSALLCRCVFSCFWVLNVVTLHGLNIQNV